MTRRVVYIGIVGVLVCLIAFWFTRNYTVEKQRVWVGMSGEARVNGLLAARLLLLRMGARVEESSSLERLARFPARGTLFLADRGQLDPVSTRLLTDWIKRGGHLVVAAEPPLSLDPLLQQLGVEVKASATPSAAARVEHVQLPDGARVRVSLPSSPILYDQHARASWLHQSHGAIQMLRVAQGRGRVTVLSTFEPFSNHDIGRLDHAEFLWRLASDEGHGADVWLVRHLDVQSLAQWLITHALACVIALSGFLLIALWRVIPRFGPLSASVELDRRSLGEHLSAMGRFYSSRRQLPRLTAVLRRESLELLGARAPETRTQGGTAQLKSAVRVTGLSPRELLQAFSGSAETPREFTAAVRVLAALRLRLLSGSAVRPARRGYAGRLAQRRHAKARAEIDRPTTREPT